ncbi:MAG: hypothetical protein P4L27_10790 [Ignavibacteriaceae bacterium]|nr:hypothetical protein [Ignavibacteriaceae bacterium]
MNFQPVSITDQVMRSLLQKAVRRGNTTMVNSVLQYFIQTGQDKWLRNRLAVITAEECWPYLGSPTHDYITLTTAIKNKDAAGLGSVALAYKNKSYYVPPDAATVEVAELLERPNYFFENTRNYKLDYPQHKFMEKAKEAYHKSTHEGDKATALAAAYLVAKHGVPQVQHTTQPTQPEFPIWVAFDKHTTLGGDAIIEAARSIGVDASSALWIAFYIEGSKCSNLAPSPWWDKYLQCRYYAHNISPEEAQDKWERLVPVLKDLLKNRVEDIKDVLSRYSPVEEAQMSLF